jgi:hypothetical protein
MTPEIKKALTLGSTRKVKAWLRDASDKDVEDYLRELMQDTQYRDMALAERDRRYFYRSQKIVRWTFVLVIVAVIVALLAWLYPRAAPLSDPSRPSAPSAASSPSISPATIPP